MDKVSVVSCTSYDQIRVYEAVKEALYNIGFEIPKGKRILIKPNIMSQNRPRQHTITHPSLIDAICRIFKENDNEILIGESISFFQKGLTQKAFVTSGIKRVADKYQARLIPFENCPLIRIAKETNEIEGLDELYIPEILSQVDLIIDACKLKTHGAMRLSGAIKNMFGCLPGGYKQKIHRWVDSEFQLADVIIDIHKNIAPTLSIMDAIVSLDGGPTALGKPVKTGLVLAAENPAALDFVAASMIGYQIDEVPLLIQAMKRNLIKGLDDIQVIGHYPHLHFEKLVRTPLDLPYNKDSIFVKHTYMDLKVKRRLCNQCKDCIPSCPVNAIRLVEGKIKLDANRCINCYHCIYVCKQNAIKIHPTLMNRLYLIIRKIIRL